MEDVKEQEPQQKSSGFLLHLTCVVWGLLLIFAAFTLSHKFVVVSGESMEPALYDGDVVISSVCTNVQVGNVYMLREPDEGYYVIKRLVGLPGDTIKFVEGALYRNDELFIKSPGDSWDNASYTLGVDEYLFLGDNRTKSYDGRYWSRFVHLDEIEYCLDDIIYPFTHRGNVHWEAMS